MISKKTKAFGAEVSFEEAALILIPAPWEATASYQSGTSKGPELIRRASSKLDFFRPSFHISYNHKIHFEQTDSLIVSLNTIAKAWAKEIQDHWAEEKKTLNTKEKLLSEKVNQASQNVLNWLYEKSSKAFLKGKIPALVGGEHSVSEALIRLIGEQYHKDYGILHIDAHADLRDSYQGFKYSHASIMRNVLNSSYAPKKLVQVGIRDFCEEEYQKIKTDLRIKCFLDEAISSRLFMGETWSHICQEIIEKLPHNIYVSLDVDGLSWSHAPGTGTPVPGGLSFNQALFLLSEIKNQGKTLIAFDVVETSPGSLSNNLSEWNGNVSARLLYYLAGLALETQNKLK